MRAVALSIRRGMKRQGVWKRLLPEPSVLADRLKLHQRSRRVFWLLFGTWIINFFDLGFTLLAHEQGILTEMNPLAMHLLLIGPLPVVAFKLSTLALGTAIVWLTRQHAFVERIVWGYAILCIGLSCWWYRFYVEADTTWVMASLTLRCLPENMVTPPIIFP